MSSCSRRTTFHTAVWDSAILLLIGSVLVTLSWTIPQLQKSDQLSDVYRWFLIIVTTVMGLGGVLTVWGSFFEPELLIVRRRKIRLPFRKKLRIAVIGDLHVGVYKDASFVERIVRTVNRLEPDIVLIAGDCIDDEAADLSDLDPLKKLETRYGVFAIPGNHDAGAYISMFTRLHYYTIDKTDDLEKRLSSYGIHFLRNKSKTITIDNEPLVIAGTDDVWMESFDLKKTCADIPDSAATILLSHNPDVILNKDSHRAHLIVSGHTHGGQIRLPFIGALTSIPDTLGRAYDRGLFHITKTCTLAITEGTGVSGVRARLFCPPEILLLETEGGE
ncbi:metallophosphoesterase [Candidatus Peribacteria bacterium]|nr:MAG: metallophosphoesterase [Candidatus Peribacteria bacterium]